MLRKARSVGVAVATLTPLAVLAVGEAAQQYDDNNKVVYAKQQLLKWRSAAEPGPSSNESSNESAAAASAWLGSAPPKFPHLKVDVFRLLGGARVVGSYEESTRGTLQRLTAPTSTLEIAIHHIAMRYAELKTSLHGGLPEDFDPRVGLKVSAEDTMMDALLDALRDLQYSEQENEEDEDSNRGRTQSGQAPALPVFLLRDFDELNDYDAERWLRWTHQVTSERMAHVVLLTSSTVTPSKVEWMQARHQNGHRADSNGIQDFVAILLRPANGLVDRTSAEDKLRKLSELHGLDLFPDEVGESEASEDENQLSYNKPSMNLTKDSRRTAEVEVILKSAGNWWSDIDAICQKLRNRKLNDVALDEERVGVIEDVCHDFVQDTEVKLLELLHLDGSLQLSRDSTASNNPDKSLPGSSLDPSDTSKAFSALEMWKCLETLGGVSPVTGGNALIGSPQQLLKQKDKTPLNCVSPVEALLPFNYREEGEQKFMDLIDQQVLFLRPKVRPQLTGIHAESWFHTYICCSNCRMPWRLA
ncbi:unnamed protein product [Phytophthora fragariaefolia]|uniref:Unnamed protein product n=1 Tax=Phytophthora fragariaefolia TaxID=1490495 RepID=A0A9W6YMG9_9STRA|nr:unnamed protein product [Phytophthora fragariaefolia]